MRDGKGPPCFSCPPHLGGWVASRARRKGASVQWQMMVSAPLCLMAPFSLTEFLCPLRRHRPLGATPFHHFVVPLPPRAGGGKFWGTRSPSPCKQGEARFWVNRSSPPCFSCPPLRGWVASEARRKGPPCFSRPPPLRGWVASEARRKGASESRTPQKSHSTLTPPK